MALTYNIGTKKGDKIEAELSQLQQDFDVRLNAIKERFFVDGKGLQVILGNNNHAIGFTIDVDLIKNQA